MTVKSKKQTISNLNRFVFMSTLMVLVLVVISSIFTMMVMKKSYISLEDHNEIIKEKDAEIALLDQENTNLVLGFEEQFEDLKVEYNKAEALFKLETDELRKTLTEANDTIEYTNKNIDKLVMKYLYVFEEVKKSNIANPISFTNVANLDKNAKDKDVDPHLVLHVARNESRYNTKASAAANGFNSNALGLTQFLGSTGRTMYAKTGRTDKYVHSKHAVDPDINLEMCVTYLDYLKGNTGNDMNRVLYFYSGNCIGPAYQQKINKAMLANVGYGLASAIKYR